MQFAAIPAGSRSLSAVVHLPVTPTAVRGWVLHLPAFADEMNKARPMVHRCASGLVAEGFVVVIPDLTGCGDSPGEFSEADWHCWRKDIDHIIDWMLQALAAPAVSLWGLRLGCLMAADVATRRPDHVRQLLFWQPVLDGKLFMNQFLRIRIAAALFSEGRESIKSLQAELTSNGHLMVAGYELSADMYTQISDLALRNMWPGVTGAVEWFDLYEGEAPTPNPATEKLISQWRENGMQVHQHTARGPRFWATQEISMAPSLLASTISTLVTGTVEGTTPGPGPESWPEDLQALSGCEPAPTELGVIFDCEGTRLAGVFHNVHSTAGAGLPQKIGVVIVVGGPQYRVGSHRHFVELSRALADNNIPVLRFDYRGMGDSDGELAGFQQVDDDIAAAVDQLKRMSPSVNGVVLLGLCDAATAASTYAQSDQRVHGLILLNPWVYSESGNARAMLSNYYLKRILGPQFWRKLLSGEVAILASLRAVLDNALVGFGLRYRTATQNTGDQDTPSIAGNGSLPEKMAEGLQRFTGPVLLALSGRDLTADEFRLAEERSAAMAAALKGQNTTRLELPAADHTFSDRASKAELESSILTWLQRL